MFVVVVVCDNASKRLWICWSANISFGLGLDRKIHIFLFNETKLIDGGFQYLLFVGIFTTKILVEVVEAMAEKQHVSDLFVLLFLIFQVIEYYQSHHLLHFD